MNKAIDNVIKKYVKKEPYKMYINGEFIISDDKKTMDVINPVNNEKFAEAYYGSVKEAERAVDSAHKAFEKGPWPRMGSKERSKYLLKAARILESRLEEFAAIEALECGKSYMSARYYDAVVCVDAFEFFAGKARGLDGKLVDCDPSILNYVIKQPKGVIAEILPWNGPLMMGCQKIPAILAGGNTVVVKPSSEAVLSMLLIAEVFDEAGFPEGVFNVITGSGREVGAYLTRSEKIDMVSLTGGTDTGKELIKMSADTVKDLALELGGKSPHIIFDDVDIERAVKWAKFGFTLNSGEVCVSGTRLIVHKNIYEEFIEKLANECQSSIPGDGFSEEGGGNFGPMISKSHAQNVWRYIEKGKEEGARLVCGGEPYTDPEISKGNFIPPTIFADVTTDMTIFNEEIFGPVVCITPFETEEEAIEIANMTVYGLAGGVATNNMAKGLRVANAIKGGQIYVNNYFSKGLVESPGTGWKQSGLGVAGIDKYMTTKTVFLELDENSSPPM